MPEGDTIFRTAEVLRRALAGKRVIAVRARYGPRYGAPPDLTRVVGTDVSEVEPRGKHLLIHFDRRLVLHTHLGMTGSWHCYPATAGVTGAGAGEMAVRRGTAAVELRVEDFTVLCYNPSVVELLDRTAVERHPALAALGPDLLSAAFDHREARERLRRDGRREIADALLDQRLVAGIGNVYKSELLFLVGVHPSRTVSEIDDGTLDSVLERAVALLHHNTAGGSRATTGKRRPAPGTNLWVYGRAGRPCRRCGSAIQIARQGDPPRSTFWCPSCQPARSPAAGDPS